MKEIFPKIALVYLTDRARVVYLPTRDGYCVMLSTPQPEALLAALKRVAMSGGSS